MTIPTSPSEITPESVTALIRSFHPDASVGGVEVVAAHVFGEGDVSTAGRIEVDVREVSGADLPARLVIKVARPDLPATPLYANKVACSTHLRGELEIEPPRCFGAQIDLES